MHCAAQARILSMELEDRLQNLVKQYASQGNHRTGTDVDRLSASWLAGEFEKSGGDAVKVRLRSFETRRRVPKVGKISLSSKDGRSWIAEGMPMYDCGEYTDLEGVSGSLGFAGEDCDLAVIRYSNSNEAVKTPGFMEARLSSRHKAVIAVYDPGVGGVEGLAVVNAQEFPSGGVGKPTLLLHSRHFETLSEAAEIHSQATVVVVMDEDIAETSNVEAEIAGTDPSLSPVLVLTPRSGWWSCAVERASSIAAFIEVIRAVAQCRPKRTVLFSANTGHELGHTGVHHFHSERPDYAKNAHICVHFGASWASKHVKESDRVALVQLADDQLEELAENSFAEHGLVRERLEFVPGSTRPIGEARELFDVGARYLSIIGLGIKEFHMEEDTESCLNLQLLCKLTEIAKAIVLQVSQDEGSEIAPKKQKLMNSQL